MSSNQLSPTYLLTFISQSLQNKNKTVCHDSYKLALNSNIK